MNEYKIVWIYGTDHPHKGDEIAGYIHKATNHYIAVELGRPAISSKYYTVWKSYKEYKSMRACSFCCYSLLEAKRKAAQTWKDEI